MRFLKIPPFLSLKRFMPRSLLARSFLILAVPVLLIQVISVYVFFDRHWDRMTDRLSDSVAGEIAVVVNQVNLESFEKRAFRSLDFVVQYKEGHKLDGKKTGYHSWGIVVGRSLSKALDKKIENPYQLYFLIKEKKVRVEVQIQDGVVSISLPKKRLFSSSGYVFLLWMMGVSFLLLFVAMLFMRNQIRPIKRLAVAADRFGKGRDVPFLKVEGAREVRQAAHAFIDMRKRIDRQIQQRTTMLAGVSHDLRTPLTRMKLQVEMFGEGEDCRNLKQDIEDMERMINAYLQFAKGEGDETSQRVDLLEVIEHLILSFQRTEGKIHFEKGEEEFSLFLRPIAFERCISNVISNAQKYAENIWIELRRDETHILIFIDDDGVGIKEENYQDVFKPFFREDKSRNSKTGGVGLGLPIAQDIVLSHGGDISLDRSPHGGLCVIIKLPL